tara:strand:- start:1378 stop:1608 length:231 start_codon:yes stop_codon:yes gene_type:complete
MYIWLLIKKKEIMKTLATKYLKITSNKSKRHFTIKTETCKYRTSIMSKDEFEDNDNNTQNDWFNFLRTDGSYYLIK